MPSRLRFVRPGVACAVCLLHLPLLLWSDPKPMRLIQPSTQPALTVRLLRSPAPVSMPAREQRRTAPADRFRAPAPALPSAAPINEPLRWVAPAVDPPPVPASGVGQATPPPLDLHLPPPAARGAGPLRPAGRPRPQSVESQLAQGLGTGPLIQESLGNGRYRLRQGRRCVELRDARMAQLDPFSQSGNPVPKQAEDCGR